MFHLLKLIAARFAFQPWHSTIEFKRYLHRFVKEFPRIDSLAGVDRTPYNQYDSIILPIETYLKAQGVKFHYGAYQLPEDIYLAMANYSCQTQKSILSHSFLAKK